jgi:hypothetical protein
MENSLIEVLKLLKLLNYLIMKIMQKNYGLLVKIMSRNIIKYILMV